MLQALEGKLDHQDMLLTVKHASLLCQSLDNVIKRFGDPVPSWGQSSLKSVLNFDENF